MLKLFNVIKNQKEEIFPVNNVYTVVELGKYEITYTSENIINECNIFLEDLPFDNSKIIINANQITLSEFRYFENYFGYASLKINKQIYHFNIQIEKLKLSEIEDIFTYLWQKESKLFNIFFSKSTYELDFRKNGFELGRTSKFITFIEKFLSTFKVLYHSFEKTPHTVLRKTTKRTQYSSRNVTPDTLDWILQNLDEIYFDKSFKTHHNALRIKNNYGIIETIFTVENEDSNNNYENQIIIGAFETVLRRLRKLKNEINSNINIKSNANTRYADFKDLKRIPFIKLFDDATSLEKQTIRLYEKYKRLFKGLSPINEKPILTTVFAQKLHYKKAYSVIRILSDYKFDLLGEFKLLNISKLSVLYEVYNLFIIADVLKNNLRINAFTHLVNSSRLDEILDKITYKNEGYEITLYYEHRYFTASIANQETSLRRIDQQSGTFYSPDFIIEIFSVKEQKKNYHLLDAKYSKLHTVSSIHLHDVLKKYIINTGIANNGNLKINSLHLICPAESGLDVIKSEFFEPTIAIIACKPNYEKELEMCIINILRSNLPENLLN